MVWNPETYLQFEEQRTRPVHELLARVPLEAPGLIFDLGCGPGNSTAALAARWPEARLVGLDNSLEMLDQARKCVSGAHWLHADIASWQPEQPVDLLFANASLQWVPQPEAAVRRLFSYLAPGGVLAFQVPANHEGPPHSLVDQALQETNLSDRVERSELSRHVLEPAAYYRALSPAARAVDIWDTKYLQVLDGEDAVFDWIKGTALVPILAVLNESEKQQFVGALRALLRAAYPREAGGKTLMPFRRRFVVAMR
jgi:trans-aconitate 2-methyltransferase